MEKSIFYNHKLDVGIEACTTQLRGLLGIESGSLYEIETAVGLDSFGDLVDYNCFIFLFHFVVVCAGLSLDRTCVDLYARTHGARKINTLDVCAFGSCGLELDQCIDKLAGVVGHLLGIE